MNYISIQSSEDVIEHFGIKGMKWGHRRGKVFTKSNLKKAAIIGGGVALAGLGAYGAYKGYGHLNNKSLQEAARNANIKKAFEIPKIKYKKVVEKSGKIVPKKGKGFEKFDYDKFKPDTVYLGPKLRRGIKVNSSELSKRTYKSSKNSYADEILKVAQQKPGILGRQKMESISDTKRKISKMAENISKMNKQVNSTGKTIDSINDQALETLNKLMKKK
jgi:hypothetical protein|nr:MAG TPA: hypothetical protein [Caudoviricetes sp.]